MVEFETADDDNVDFLTKNISFIPTTLSLSILGSGLVYHGIVCDKTTTG